MQCPVVLLRAIAYFPLQLRFKFPLHRIFYYQKSPYAAQHSRALSKFENGASRTAASRRKWPASDVSPAIRDVSQGAEKNRPSAGRPQVPLATQAV
jgi:hypothetical protein